MASFVETISPTAFGFFDTDAAFQAEADSMVKFVKRALGDDILQVELTKKQIWTEFEQACLIYSRLVNEMRTTSDLVNVLGLPTGSSDLTNVYPRQTLEFLLRQAEPYASTAGIGGAYDLTLAFFSLQQGKQDYDIYTDLIVANGPNSGSLVIDTLPSGSKTQIRIMELMHFEPLAAQQFLLNASNITNFLATNFNYESYVNSTVFYVLPVFEDVLRRQMLETAFRVRRSNFSYSIIGSKVRIYPIPNSEFTLGNLFATVQVGQQNPLIDSGSTGITFQDDTLFGVNGPQNIPLDNIPYKNITSPGRQWIRQYTLALCRELLGLIRSKFETVPIPNAELRLNGEALVTQGREDKEKLTDQLREFLSGLTRDKLLEREVAVSENVQKQLRMVPMVLGKSIFVG